MNKSCSKKRGGKVLSDKKIVKEVKKVAKEVEAHERAERSRK